MLPVESNADVVFYNHGPTLFDLNEALQNASVLSKDSIYITMENRNYHKLN